MIAAKLATIAIAVPDGGPGEPNGEPTKAGASRRPATITPANWLFRPHQATSRDSKIASRSEGSLVRVQLRPPGRRGEHVPGVLPRLPRLQAVRGLGRLTLTKRSWRIAFMHASDGRLPPAASGCYPAVCQRPSSALRISSARRLRKAHCGARPIPVEELREQHPYRLPPDLGDGSPIRRHPQG